MFFPNDSVSEIIAHFVGHFEVCIEDLRLRQSYEEFGLPADLREPPPGLPNIIVPFLQRLDLDGYNPNVPYTPERETIDGALRITGVRIVLKDIPLGEVYLPPTPFHATPAYGGGDGHPMVRISAGPPSAIIQASQIIVLDDNDLVILGPSDLALASYSFDAAPFLTMVDDGNAIAEPITDIETPHTVEDVPIFIEAVAQTIADFAQTPPANAETAFGPHSSGVHLDGESVTEAPLLADALPASLQDEPEAEPVSAISLTPDGLSGTVEVIAGADHLDNQAVVINAGAAATFFGVVGDVHQVDAIVQTNIYTDIDTLVGSYTPGGAATAAHNVASLIHEVRDTAGERAEANPGVLPKAWTVTVIQGDMIFYSWVEQYNFLSDNDTHTLTATGTTVTVTSGENLASNIFSFVDLGRMYDLIIVAGNVYDANVIVQTNILYDNDSLDLIAGANAATGGNLLWNEASIQNIGGDWQIGLPESYREAADSLAAGDYQMPVSLRSDEGFEGYATLKVLYVSGSIYDLHYIQQTNVLWDADAVSMFETSMRAASDTEWSIGIGDNALINVASVIDYDSIGATAFLGGDLYSDAILIQAELVSGDSDLTPDSADALVTEVIAFLDGDDDVPFSHDDGPIHTMHDGPSADIMQSVLA